ncbi:Uncharacterized protein dnm_038320 [Desulfonema magnum]|uniref:Uncharacterized protein n=1 Tax=Desulfonema magnum TaxID=45655 RepID=A0A975GNI1_9BACT|nr:Uncharacterized protein dnm_038320 [Desulfonema magnum]
MTGICKPSAANMPPLQGLAGGLQTRGYKYAALTGLGRLTLNPL